MLAIIGAGGIFTGSNPAYTPHELAHHIKASESRFLISEPEILEPLLRAAAETGISDRHVWVFDNLGQPMPPKRQSWKELLSFGEEDWVRFDDLKKAQSTTAARLFSSGTTGLPKAVTITHYNLIAQHELVLGANPRPYSVSVSAFPHEPLAVLFLCVYVPRNRTTTDKYPYRSRASLRSPSSMLPRPLSLTFQH